MDMTDNGTPRCHLYRKGLVPVLGAFGAMTIVLLREAEYGFEVCEVGLPESYDVGPRVG